MSKHWRIKPGRNLRENARVLVPAMMNVFLSRRDTVIHHPRLKLVLHRMRLDGKELRYAMETFEPTFGPGFSRALDEVKTLLDVMGQIHDCDINIPRLQGHLKEIRLYNNRRDSAGDKIPTSALTKLIRSLLSRRRELFAEMTVILERWDRDKFGEMIVYSMNSDTM